MNACLFAIHLENNIRKRKFAEQNKKIMNNEFYLLLEYEFLFNCDSLVEQATV